MWTITIFNPDGTVHATGSSTLTGPGVGKSVTIPAQQYSCNNNHTLTGQQTSVNAMSGNGVNPYPDPGVTAEKYPGGLNPPSWDASGGGPEPEPPK